MSRLPVNLVHAEVLSPHARLLTEGGAPTERLFERCGIPLPVLYDPSAIITMRQAHHLMGEAARYAGSEVFGAQAGRTLHLSELGALGHALQQAPSLYNAGKVVMAAVNASEPGSQCWIEEDESDAWFFYHPVHRFGEGGSQAEQFDLQCLLMFIRIAAGPEWTPQKVRTTAATAEALHATAEFAEADVERNTRGSAVAFPKHLLARPLLDSIREGGSTGSGNGETAGSALPLSGAVTSLLESLFNFESLPVLEVMADRLGMNARTLQRSLAAEETTYRSLTQRLLFRRAAALLEDERLLVKTISAELGYSSPNSFVRAFREISGVTPKAWRKLNRIPAG
jgi:AraC-like DNA-binding protein